MTDVKTPERHAVVYSDGSSRPSRGLGGYGFHGYVYENTPQKTGTGCKVAHPTAKGYVKGSKAGGDITVEYYVDGYGPLIPETTNNIAEIKGATEAIRSIQDEKLVSVLLITDSQYVKQGLDGWAKQWEANNWLRNDGTPVPNADYWKELISEVEGVRNGGAVFECQWVKGHGKGEALGNDIADAHSNRGRTIGLNLHFNHIENNRAYDISRRTPAKGYWSGRTERNRLISHPKWYFNPADNGGLISADGRSVYYFGNAGDDDDLIGRRNSTATYSVLYLKEADPYLSIIRNAVKSMGRHTHQGPVRAYLDKIFSEEAMQDLDNTADMALLRDLDKQRVLTYSEQLLCEEMRPAKLAYRGFDALNTLQGVLDEYLTAQAGSRVRATDITDHLYETTSSTKKTTVKLKPDIKQTTRTLDVEATYASVDETAKQTKLTLTLGLDLPDRNTLSAIADERVRVVVLTWPDGARAIRFAVVVHVGDDVGIWSGIYSNLHMLAS